MKKNIKTLAIIQARSDSKRFPNKMLKSLGNHKIIEWVIGRVKKSKFIDKLILALPLIDKESNLHNITKKYDIEYFFGSEENVLERFYLCSNNHKSDSIMRICADNPFIDHRELDRLIKFYNTSFPDLAFNHRPIFGCEYPDGLGAEIFSKKILEYLYLNVSNTIEREHVTKHLWNNYGSFNIKFVQTPILLNYPKLKFDIDTEFDLNHLNNFVSKYKINLDDQSKNIIKKYLQFINYK